MEEKLLTIIVPAYNVERYLAECLDSLVNQTVQDHFVIIIDDGSTDSTSEICDQYVKKYPELFYCIHQKNQGAGKARNIAIDLVKSKYFTFLDGDDWWDLEYVEKVKEELEYFPGESIEIIYTLPTIFDTLTKNYVDWHDKSLFMDIFYNGNRIVSVAEDNRLYQLEYSACRKVFLTEFSKKIKFYFDEGVKWEDVFPHFYTTYYAKRCLGIKEIGFNYRINIGGQTTSISDSSRLDMIQAFAKTVHFIIKENMSIKDRNLILERMFSFTKWCLNSSNQSTRLNLIKEIASFVKVIPKEYIKTYKNSTKNKKEKMFLMVLKYNFLQKLYIDYIIKEKMKTTWDKLKEVKRHD